jgi:hypothetical protein
MIPKPRRRLSAFDERRVAVTGHLDPRSVRKAIAGEPVSPMVLARTRAALAQLGLPDLLPSSSDAR